MQITECEDTDDRLDLAQSICRGSSPAMPIAYAPCVVLLIGFAIALTLESSTAQ